MKHIYFLFPLFILFFQVNTQAQKNITVDFSQQQGEIKDLLGVNKGPKNKLQGYKDAGISMIRTHDYHGPFDYEYYSDFWNYNQVDGYTLNNSFDPTNPAHYDWTDTDSRLDAIAGNNIEVYFRLGVSYPDNPNYDTPPLAPPLDSDDENFATFAEVCKRTAMHCNSDWAGGKNLSIRYWEVWNEPGGAFWKGTADQFYKMYNTVCDSLKSFDSSLKVGALGAVPTTSIGISPEYRENFLNYLNNNDVPLDFYSWHLYGYKNPYGIKMWADTMQNILDQYGFTNTENHISEINDDLGGDLDELNESPAGTAYYLSSLITAQNAPIDKFFWYQGLGFFNADDGNNPSYIYSGYALKSYSLLLKNTPIQLKTTGDEVIDGFWQTDTTNLMTLAGKSEDDKKVYILLSNYNSLRSDFNITINNLPWNSSDEIVCTKNIVDTENVFTENQMVLEGNHSLTISVNNLPSPAVAVIRLEKAGNTYINQLNNEEKLFRLYPNPIKRNGNIYLSISKKIQQGNLLINNANGKRIHEKTINSSGLHKVPVQGFTPGLYFLTLKTPKTSKTVKFTIE